MSHLVCDSEIGTLQKVLVHRPDAGIQRMNPKRSEELLFDDIVFLPKIQEEHDVFTDLLKAFLGSDNVLFIEQLIEESIAADSLARVDLIMDVLDFEELPRTIYPLLEKLDPKTLTEVLITGYIEEEDYILFDPIPNFIFTRDVAVMIHDHILITKASKEARHRENYLVRFVLYHHPLFKDFVAENRFVDLNDLEKFPPSRKGEAVSLEGGDVMMFDHDYLLVGCSERTTEHAIQALRDELFRKGVVKHVVQINIPSDRSYMHIDTIFTRVASDVIACYKPIVFDGLGSTVVVYTQDEKDRTYLSLKDFFYKEINADMNFVFTGNGISPYQEREQWTDGCNLVALKDGVAITYDRNVVTEKAFFEQGFSIRSAEDLVYEIRKGNTAISDIQKTIITIPSAELSRARGGSHCMTCPLQRSTI